jgi:serine/threonine protein kinase
MTLPTDTQKPPWLPSLIDQVLSALTYLQAQGMLHRDIKPENILYDETANKGPTFLLSDFGLAVLQSLAVQDVRSAGYVGRMPPEISQENKPHIKSDLYAFGIMLLEILGLYCTLEEKPNFDWRATLREFGVMDGRWRDYRDMAPWMAHETSVQSIRGQSRVESLLQYQIIPRTLSCLLAWNPDDRDTAAGARAQLRRLYGKHGTAVPGPYGASRQGTASYGGSEQPVGLAAKGSVGQPLDPRVDERGGRARKQERPPGTKERRSIPTRSHTIEDRRKNPQGAPGQAANLAFRPR